MDRAEFDKFADEYRALHAKNIRLSGEGPDYFARYKVEAVARRAMKAGHRVGTILDFGAGTGTSVPWFSKFFTGARVTCLDVSERSLDVGRTLHGASANFLGFDGQRIPLGDGSIDVAFAACVFHHIEPAQHVPLLAELRRVLAPGGMLALFEHNPLNPLTVAAVNQCEFDENAILIGPWTLRKRAAAARLEDLELRFRVFFPGPLRALRVLEPALGWCPAGAQYSVFGWRRGP